MNGDDEMDYREEVEKYRYDIDIGLELASTMLLGDDMVALGHVKTAKLHLETIVKLCNIIMGIEEIPVVNDEITDLKARLNDAQDLLHDCGYCRECFWNGDSIGDVAAHLFEEAYSKGEVPEWPSDCTPLCRSCTVDFKNYFTESV